MENEESFSKFFFLTFAHNYSVYCYATSHPVKFLKIVLNIFLPDKWNLSLFSLQVLKGLISKDYFISANFVLKI